MSGSSPPGWADAGDDVPPLLQLALDRLPDGILIHRGGQVLFANEVIRGWVGRERSDPASLELLPPRVRRSAQARLPSSPRPHAHVRVKVRPATGPARVVEFESVQSLELERGPAALLVARTGPHEGGAHRLKSSRLAVMDRIVPAVVHDINNGLVFVLANHTLIGRQIDALELPPRVKYELLTALADARAGADRVRQIAGDLRMFAESDHRAVRRLDMRRVVDGAVSLLWGELRHRARLVKDYGPVPAVQGDETLLRHVFLLLVLNAARALQEGDADAQQVRLTVGTDADGWATVEVRDSGRALSDAALRDWWRAPDARADLGGLNLGICRTIVRDLGGDIHAEKVPAGGTRFTVRLPATEGPPDPVDSTLMGRVRDSTINGRVLFVDDEPAIATFVRRALQGHDVYFASGGRDALDLCGQATFDVVLCDLRMPDMTGTTFYQRLRELRAEVADRVVFMTAGPLSTHARNFLDSTSAVVLYKPFEIKDIERVVGHVLAIRGKADVAASR